MSLFNRFRVFPEILPISVDNFGDKDFNKLANPHNMGLSLDCLKFHQNENIQ